VTSSTITSTSTSTTTSITTTTTTSATTTTTTAPCMLTFSLSLLYDRNLLIICLSNFRLFNTRYIR
jgi:hypothetical protein